MCCVLLVHVHACQYVKHIVTIKFTCTCICIGILYCVSLMIIFFLHLFLFSVFIPPSLPLSLSLTESLLQINDELNSCFTRYERHMKNRQAVINPLQPKNGEEDTSFAPLPPPPVVSFTFSLLKLNKSIDQTMLFTIVVVIMLQWNLYITVTV